MKFSSTTPRDSATVQGFKLTIPIIFPTVETYNDLIALLSSQEIAPSTVSSLLQTIFCIENPRNNIAKKIKDEVIEPVLKATVEADPETYLTESDDEPSIVSRNEDGTISYSWNGRIDSIPDSLKTYLAEHFTDAAQQVSDDYIESYTPGAPKRRGTTGPSLDPVEDLAQKNAAIELYARWKDVIWTDSRSKRWQGIKSQDRANSAHRAANEMLAFGTVPSFMNQRVFDAFDGEITSVSEYVNAYVSLVFAEDAKETVKAVAERLRTDARATLDRVTEASKSFLLDEELG